MRRDQARRQLLVLLLFAGLGVLCLDLEPLRAAVADYLHGVPETRVAGAGDDPRPSQPGPSARGPALAASPASDVPAAAPARGVAPASARAPRRWVVYPAPRLRLHGIEDARRRLRLTADQGAGLERIAADARRDLDDLRYVRNDRGQSWHGIVAAVERIPALEEAHRVAETLRRLARFVDTELSGRGETYRETHRRLLDGCRELTTRLLAPEQLAILAGLDCDLVFDDSPYAAAAGGRHAVLAQCRALRRPGPRLEAREPRAG